MAQYNFEGNFDNIDESQLHFINKVILEHKSNVKRLIFEPVGQAGDNFMANVQRLIIEGKNDKLNMIVKIAPTNENFRRQMNSELFFKNEHIMYTEVLPRMEKLQEDAGIPKDERLRYAKCYGSSTKVPHEVIILEDLAVSDFKMLNKLDPLSDECVRSVLNNFAKLHSISYALKKTDPETFELFKGKLVDLWAMMAHLEETIQQFKFFDVSCVSIFVEDKHKEIAKNKVAGVLEEAYQLAKYEETSKYSVIIQGDGWTNNIMFRFEEDRLKESIMIDYQVSKNSSPAFDLLYFIFNCTDYESRSQNYYKWLDYYHEELDKYLSKFDLKANEVYPREVLDADLKRHSKMILGLCIFTSNMLMREKDESAEIIKAIQSTDANEARDLLNVEHMENKTTVRVRNKCVGIMESYLSFGLI